LRLGYRGITIAGFAILTVGFALLAMFDRTWPVVWIYIDLTIIGSGLGCTMLTLLIAVQQAVDRSKLGIATSLNQFSRSIGGALGVAIMGAVLSAGLTSALKSVAQNGDGNMTAEQAEAYASNPNALIEPTAKAQIPQSTLDVLQDALASAIHPVFWSGALAAGLGFLVVLFLPKHERGEEHEVDGERLIMAEQTVINARNQPAADEA